MSVSTSHSIEGQQQLNGFPGKSELISNGISHDNHMTSSNTGTNSSGSECGVYDTTLLEEDAFYSFDENDPKSLAVQSVLDPLNSNAFPIIDGCFIPDDMSGEGQDFDPVLFDSILSTGNEILASLESTSHGTYDLPTDSMSSREGGEEEDVVEPLSHVGTDDPFDDFVKVRALSTIIEDQGEGQDHSDDSDTDYVRLDNIKTSLHQLPSNHSQPPEGGKTPPKSLPEMKTGPPSSEDVNSSPPAPLRSTSLKNSSSTANQSPKTTGEGNNGKISQSSASEKAEGSNSNQHRALSRLVQTPPSPLLEQSKLGSTPKNVKEDEESTNEATLKTIPSDNSSRSPSQPPLSECDTSVIQYHVSMVVSGDPKPPQSEEPSEDDMTERSLSNKDPEVVTLAQGNEVTTSLLAAPLEEVAINHKPDIVLEGVAAPLSDDTLSNASNLDSLESSLDRTNVSRFSRDVSDLDGGKVRPALNSSPTTSRRSSNNSPILSRSRNDSPLLIRRVSSANPSPSSSPVLRSKSPHTPTGRPSSQMAVLQPLSPDHGADLTEQYEFLRRTLSHSQRRYSQRGRNPRGGKGRGKATAGQSLREPNRVGNRIANGHVTGLAGQEGINSLETRKKQTIGHLRDILRESNAVNSSTLPPRRHNEDMETHVDQHGRTYYMDHNTRTIAYDRAVNPGFSPQQQEMQTRREMLDRRYQSLQRSFRRTERPAVKIKKRSTFYQSRKAPGTATATANENSGAIAENEVGNNSFSLTLAEAEEMARNLSQSGSRSKFKVRTNSSKSGRLKFFSRKSQKLKNITQQSSTSSNDDDIMPVFSPPASFETTPQPENISVISDTIISHSSGSESDSRVGSEVGVTSTPVSLASFNTFSDRDLTPSSIQSAEFESGTEEGTPTRTATKEVEPTTNQLSKKQEPSPTDETGQTEESVHAKPQDSEAASSTASPNDLPESEHQERQTTLSEADKSAASRAKVNKKKSRERLNTDELTNQMQETVEVPIASQDTLQRHIETPIVEGRGDTESKPADSSSTVKSKEPSRSNVTRGSKRKSRRTVKSLATSPALRFITRKDLFSFLSSAGTAGEEFFANRALMELVQRIRSNNTLFEKYEHSHHLVGALNKFADVHADLPDGWEKKLNRQGKIFFIDHKNELTTFLDPRLPLPDTPYSYNPSSENISRKTSEPYIRPHHTVVAQTHSLETPTIVEPEPDTTTLPTPTSATSNSSLSPSRLSTASTSVEVTPVSYESQVVAFFRQPNIAEIISERYSRGVRPQFQAVIEAIKVSGATALERIQMSGSVITYELALVLSLFEEDISQMRPTPEVSDNEEPGLSPPAVPISQSLPPDTSGKSTLQRRKEAFPTKLQNFKMMMARLGFVQGSRIKYNIRRDHMLEDAYEHIMKSDLKLLQKKRLNITFKGEEGLDYGGPSREFFFLLSREIFNPYYGLFEYSANDTYTIQISPTAAFIHNSMEWFRFAGRVVGLVIVQGFLLDVFFTRTVYKSLLNRPQSLKDLEALEPDFYNSLLWIRDNDPEPLDLTFTVEEEAFGQLNGHELKPGGADLPVTEDNKDEYIDLMVRWRLDRGVAEQMNAFKKGFGEIMPVTLLANFDAQELEFITAGTLEIDVADWKAHTEYRNGYHAAHQVVVWFWHAVEKFDNEERLRLLQFVTGTSSVPIEGFKALRGSNGPKRFTIDYYNNVEAFPRSHTCFNRIDLPPYPSFDILFHKLSFAVTEGGGFGIE